MQQDAKQDIAVRRQANYPGNPILVSGEDESKLVAVFDLVAESGINILDAIPKPINMTYFGTLLYRVPVA